MANLALIDENGLEFQNVVKIAVFRWFSLPRDDWLAYKGFTIYVLNFPPEWPDTK